MTLNLSALSRKIPICLALIVLTVAVFYQVRDFDFVGIDDKMYIHENRQVLSGLTLAGVKWAFSSFYASNWHPLTWLSHMLDVELFGLDAGRFHLVNLFFHIAASLMLFLILERTTGVIWQSAFVAAMFAVHPLHVESVAWIAQRKDVLSAFFLMLTLGAYVFYVEKPHPGRYIATLSFFALGLMSKPMLVSVPLVLLLLDYWPLGRLRAAPMPPNGVAGSAEKTTTKNRKKQKGQAAASKQPSLTKKPDQQTPAWARLLVLIREKIPFFLLSAASSLITVYAQQQSAVVSLERIPLFARATNAAVSYVSYIGKTVWPQHLAVFYPYQDVLPLWQIAGATMLLAGITATAFFCIRRMPFVTVGWLWFVVTLTPVIGLVQVGMQAMADRYTYIPHIGLFIMASWGVAGLAGKRRYAKEALAVASILIVASAAVVAFKQVGHWRNSVSLFSHALAVTKENHLAHSNLGVALSAAGDRSAAAFHYAEALRINPRHASYHYNYANHLATTGRADEAVAHYTEAIRLQPDYFNALNNLGLTLAARREFEKAATHYRQALQLKPDEAGVHYNLAVALANMGNRTEAERSLREALRANPRFAEAHNDLGMLLAMQGKLQEGIVHFREALRLKPGYAAATHNLNIALGNLNNKRK